MKKKSQVKYAEMIAPYHLRISWCTKIEGLYEECISHIFWFVYHIPTGTVFSTVGADLTVFSKN